jgi:hypothetical protein
MRVKLMLLKATIIFLEIVAFLLFVLIIDCITTKIIVL